MKSNFYEEKKKVIIALAAAMKQLLGAKLLSYFSADLFGKGEVLKGVFLNQESKQALCVINDNKRIEVKIDLLNYTRLITTTTCINLLLMASNLRLSLLFYMYVYNIKDYQHACSTLPCIV